jgi:lysocardiolipin and lysophospholipid acyltransferase
MLVLSLFIASAAIGTLVFILPVSILLVIPAAVPLACYRTVADAVQRSWLTLAAALIEWVGGVNITVSGDLPREGERSTIVICNHHCRLDWMFFWCLSARAGWLTSLTIMLKAGLKKVPLFGWACQAFHFIFLQRNKREADLGIIDEVLRYLVAIGSPTTVLCFPEGTDLAPECVARCHEYAAKKGLPKLKHTMYPRTAGFISTVRALGANLDAIYDVTVSYTNHPAVVTSPDPRPSEWRMFIKGYWPSAVHFHVARITTAQLLSAGDSDEALANWLEATWTAKEVRLAAGQLGSPPAAAPVRIYRAHYMFAFLGWGMCAVACTHTLLSSRMLWAYFICACVAWAVVTKVFGGLGDLERKLHGPRVLRRPQ